MDWFQSQESLTTIEWALRALVAFFFLVIVARLLGQRAISQLRLLDFVIALVIGNIIAHPLSDPHLGLKGSVVTTIVLVVLYLCGIFMIIKLPWFRRLINSHPITIVQDGQIDYKQLIKARISIDVLLEELRENKIEDVSKVALAVWEANGKFSFFLDPKYEPITPELSNINTESFYLPKNIIKDGELNYEVLNQLNKDESWVNSILNDEFDTEIEKVLLASIDRNGSIKINFYK